MPGEVDGFAGEEGLCLLNPVVVCWQASRAILALLYEETWRKLSYS